MEKAGFKKLLALSGVEWRLRQQSTFLGFLWTLLNPALMFAVLYGLFVKWLGRAQGDYAVFLLIGIVEWNFFASATSQALSSLLRRGPLLKNYPLSPEIPALASVLSVYFSHLLELAALAALLAFMQGGLSASWLWLIAIDIAYLALAAGAGLMLAGLYVFYSDLERIWSILLTAGFFLTPIFYPLSVLAPEKSRLLAFSPLTAVIESARLALSGSAPQPGAVACAFLWGAAALAAGLAFLRFKRAGIEDAL
ncbi:MAG: ABC transporter permease, partial [Elusimicrobiota bacterium]|nr:ABC transporter permease [Elusimicrobiota bacterium]